VATQRRAWPNAAKEARDQAGEAAMHGIRMLRPLVDGEQVDRTETVRRQAQALSDLQRIAWLMAAQGAPIRPEDMQ
jgi:hypothetical protein